MRWIAGAGEESAGRTYVRGAEGRKEGRKEGR